MSQRALQLRLAKQGRRTRAAPRVTESELGTMVMSLFNAEAFHFGLITITLCAAVYYAAGSVPMAAAQCEVRPTLAQKGYALPLIWNIATQPTLQLPAGVIPSELIMTDASCWNHYEIRKFVLQRGNDTTTRQAAPFMTGTIDLKKAVCDQKPKTYRASLHWSCEFPAGGKFAAARDIFYPSPEGTHLLIDTGALSSFRASQPTVTRLTCSFTPGFSPWYSYYLKLADNGKEDHTLAETLSRMGTTLISTRLLGSHPLMASEYPEHTLLEETYQQITLTPAFRVDIPWQPCESAYTNNEVTIVLPGSALQSRERELYTGEAAVPETRAVGADGTEIKVVALKQADESLRAFAADVRRQTFVNAEQIQITHHPDESARILAEIARHSEYAGAAVNSDIVHAHCEDAVWPHSSALRTDRDIADAIQSRWLLYEKDGVQTPSRIVKYGWVPRNITDPIWEALSEQRDSCSRRFGSRLFVVETDASSKQFFFQFDASQHAPEIVIASQRAARIPHQCQSDAIYHAETSVKLPQNQALNLLQHSCLLQSQSAGATGSDVYYSYSFVEQAKRPTGCTNGQLHHTWTGVACGQTSSARIISAVVDTTPPVPVEAALRTLPWVREPNATHAGMKLMVDCAYPSEGGDSAQGLSLTRVGGRHLFCLNKRAQLALNGFFEDNCAAGMYNKVLPAWRFAKISRCPHSTDAKGQFPHFACEPLADIPYKQSPFYNTVKDRNEFEDEDVCIDVQAWTQRHHFMRLTAAVRARDACGNLSQVDAMTPTILYQLTIINPGIAEQDQARAQYCRKS